MLEASATSPDHLATMLAERCAGVPLEHVVGWAAFCGLRVVVRPGVFVPRARTGLLVDLVADLRPRLLVDLCCGSGAVGAAVAHRVPGVEVHAADLDPASVACARENLPADRVHEGDLYEALPGHLRGRVDVLVANAPYVPTGALGTMPGEARDHEPLLALDGGPDGVDVHRRVAAGATDWLAPGGTLVVETGRSRARLTVAACEAAGLAARVVTDDDRAATAVVAQAASTQRP